MHSLERESIKKTKVKAAVKLYQNTAPTIKMARDFEKQAESVGHQSLTREAGKYVEEHGLRLKIHTLTHPASQKKEMLCMEGNEKVT